MNDCRRCKACAGHGAGMLLLLACARAAATDVVVYDDALQSGWQDYSYGGGSNFASTAQAHGGSQSIAFTGGGGAGAYNAVSLYHPADYTTAAYPTLHFWVHGGSSGGQQLYLFLQDANGIVAQAPLDAYIAGGAIVAGTWKEVTVPLTGGALAYSGPYRRIDLQSDSNSAQPLLYLDDISLRAAATDAIFANGFEGTGPGVPTLVQEHDVNVLSMPSDRFTWRDSSNRARVASLAARRAANCASSATKPPAARAWCAPRAAAPAASATWCPTPTARRTARRGTATPPAWATSAAAPGRACSRGATTPSSASSPPTRATAPRRHRRPSTTCR